MEIREAATRVYTRYMNAANSKNFLKKIYSAHLERVAGFFCAEAVAGTLQKTLDGSVGGMSLYGWALFITFNILYIDILRIYIFIY